MTDWGVHMSGYALLGLQVADPVSVMATGGKFAAPDGGSETPDTLTVAYGVEEFGIIWEHTIGLSQGPYCRDYCVAFIGEKRNLVLNRRGWEVLQEKGRMEAVPMQKPQETGLLTHMNNFVEAILWKDASILNAPIQVGGDIAIFSQLGNIAYRHGEKLYWDKSKR